MINMDEGLRLEARQALERVLGSGFVGGKSRLGPLLRAIVTEELEGRGDRLKAYTIGVDVFGRPGDFDPIADGIVRVEFNRLRKALEDYYLNDGSNDLLRIYIPKGNYRPIFIRQPSRSTEQTKAARRAGGSSGGLRNVEPEMSAAPIVPVGQQSYGSGPEISGGMPPLTLPGGNGEQAGSSDGVVDDIGTGLARNRFLSIAPRSSSFHLELVFALGAHRHFGRAAESLGISQPALTKNLLHMERMLGVRLFERTGSIRPTAFGKVVLDRGPSIVQAFDELLREIHLAKNVDTQPLSISADLYPAEISAQEAIGTLSRTDPSIACTLAVKTGAEVVDDVLAARADLGFADIAEAARHPELEVELVRKCEFLVICRIGHPLTLLSRVTLADLLEFPWVGVNIPRSIQAFLPVTPKPFGIIDNATGLAWPRIRVETFSGIKQIVMSSDALAGAPTALLDRNAGRLTALPIDLPRLGLNYGFIRRKGRTLSPSAKAFVEIVHGIEGKLTDSLGPRARSIA